MKKRHDAEPHYNLPYTHITPLAAMLPLLRRLPLLARYAEVITMPPPLAMLMFYCRHTLSYVAGYAGYAAIGHTTRRYVIIEYGCWLRHSAGWRYAEDTLAMT